MQELADQFGNTDLKILAIYVPWHDDRIEEMEMEKIRSLKEELKLDFATPIDRGLELFNQFGVKATPSTILLNKKGQITFTLAGYPWAMEKVLKNTVAQQLANEKANRFSLENTSSPKSLEQKSDKNKSFLHLLLKLCCLPE